MRKVLGALLMFLTLSCTNAYSQEFGASLMTGVPFGGGASGVMGAALHHSLSDSDKKSATPSEIKPAAPMRTPEESATLFWGIVATIAGFCALIKLIEYVSFKFTKD